MDDEALILLVVGGVAAYFLLGSAPVAGIDAPAIASAAAATSPAGMRTGANGALAGFVSQMPGGELAVKAQNLISGLLSPFNSAPSESSDPGYSAAGRVAREFGRGGGPNPAVLDRSAEVYMGTPSSEYAVGATLWSTAPPSPGIIGAERVSIEEWRASRASTTVRSTTPATSSRATTPQR